MAFGEADAPPRLRVRGNRHDVTLRITTARPLRYPHASGALAQLAELWTFNP